MLSERFRASVSGTVTGLRGTRAPVRTRRASVTDLMALMTGSPCPRVATLTDHEKGARRGVGRRHGEVLENVEVTMISLLGSLVGLINRR